MSLQSIFSWVDEHCFTPARSVLLCVGGATLDAGASRQIHDLQSIGAQVNTFADLAAPFVRLMGLGTVVLVFMWHVAKSLFKLRACYRNWKKG